MSLNYLKQFSTYSVIYNKPSLIAHCFYVNNNYQQLARLGAASKPAKQRFTAELVKKEKMQKKIRSIYQSIEMKQEKIKQLERMVVKQERKVKQAMIDYYDNDDDIYYLDEKDPSKK